MDDKLKNKLDTLDPLAGGIVFAREEAWDKLAARMDRKPARRRAIWISVPAVAAALLVAIFITTRKTPQPAVAVTQAPVASPAQPAAVPPAPPAPTPPARITQHNQPLIPRPALLPAPHIDVEEPAIPAGATADAVTPTGQDTGVAVATPPIKPAIPVIHVNELEHPGNVTDAVIGADVATGPYGRHHNSLPFLTIPRHSGGDAASPARASNPFNIIIDIQN